MKTLLGYKLGQSQTFVDGKRIPVTTIAAGPCWITQFDGGMVQLGFGNIKNLSKAEIGHLKKAGLEKKLRFLRSFKTEEADLKVGAEVKVGDVFAAGDKVEVVGTSKGKGFAGAVKRHGFAGGPHTHGQSDRERAPGAIGSTTTPGRVHRGKRMAGRMGSDRITLKHLPVIAVDTEKNILTIKGLVPGPKTGLLILSKE